MRFTHCDSEKTNDQYNFANTLTGVKDIRLPYYKPCFES